MWRAAPYLASLALILLFYGPLILRIGYITAGDYVDFFVPVRAYAARALHSGRIPFWAPELFGGYPFAADPQSAVFYPPNLLLSLVCPDPGSSAVMDLFVLLQHLVIALGAVFLARSVGVGRLGSVVASLIATLNGYQVMHFAQINMAAAEGVSFIALGCLARSLRQMNVRWASASGLAFASLVLAGHPQCALFAFYAAAMLGATFCARELFWRRQPNRAVQAAGLCALALVIGIGGSLVQILPTRDFLHDSQRESLSLQDATPAELPIRHLAGLFFPGLYQPLQWRLPPDLRHAVTHNNWGSGVAFEYLFHIGFVAFILGLFGWLLNTRRALAQWLFWGSLFLLVCAMGKQGHVYRLLFEYAPGFRQIRIPTRLLWLAGMAWGILAGLGLDALISGAPSVSIRRPARACLLICLLIAAGGATIIAAAYLHTGSRILAFQKLFVSNPGFLLTVHRSSPAFITDITQQLMIAGATLALCSLWFVAASQKPGRRLALAGVAIAALYGELLLYGFHKNIVFGSEGFTDCVDSMYKALPKEQDGRVLSTDPGPWGKNTALAAGRQLAQGYNPLLIESVANFLPRETTSLGQRYNETLMDLWNVRYLLFHRRNLDLRAAGKSLTVPSAGWITISHGDPLACNSVAWGLETTSPTKALHMISAAAYAPHLPQGKAIATFQANGRDGCTSGEFPVRLGYETAEWSYPRTTTRNWPRHKMAMVAFMNPLDEAYCANGLFFRGVFRFPGVCPVTSVTLHSRVLTDTRAQNFEYHFRVSDHVLRGAARLLPGMLQAPFGRYLDQPMPTSAALCISHLIVEDTSGSVQVSAAPEAFGAKLVESHDPAWIVAERQRKPCGEAWMVPTARAVSYKQDYRMVRALLQDAQFDPTRTVLLPTREASPDLLADCNAPEPSRFSGNAKRTDFSPERFTVRATTNQNGWLVLSHPYYRNWRAELDGKPVRLYRANGCFCAVAVPTGQHTLKMEYHERRFAPGAALSIVSWLIGIALLCRRRGAPGSVPA